MLKIKKLLESKTGIIIFSIIAIFGIGAAYHMSCQEKYVKKTNEKNVSVGLAFLDGIKCHNFEHMRCSRFFGTGVTNVVISIIIGSHIFFAKK
jgi:hypothetical protein